MAHSWVQMFPTEYDAFKKYAEMYPDACVLLVDTYNVLRHGVPDAIKVFDEVLKPMGKRPKGHSHRLRRYCLLVQESPQDAGRGRLPRLHDLRVQLSG